VNDSLCYPDMLPVYEREKGRMWFACLHLFMIARKLLYAWFPWQLRVHLRRFLPL